VTAVEVSAMRDALARLIVLLAAPVGWLIDRELAHADWSLDLDPEDTP
jgi:hypothetical protein